jgi:hypothetical protein
MHLNTAFIMLVQRQQNGLKPITHFVLSQKHAMTDVILK